MRKKLLNSIDELDMENLTPSDYCLQGHYMKFESYTQESMEKEVREFFNQEYDMLGDKIEYVNPAYNIGSYYELSEKIRLLSKEMQMVDEYIAKNGYTLAKYVDMMENYKHDETFPKKSGGGICGGTKPIDYQETKDAIAEIKKEMEEYEK